MRTRADQAELLPDIACACATLRRATRLVTQLYDEELRPPLQASQFALLAAIASQYICNRPTLMRTLAFDKTSLSRNLSVLKRKGWIRHADHPERGLRLTASGRAILTSARPHWRRRARVGWVRIVPFG
jgi:DNA-binding MarR family transcriptional regulator